MSGTWNSIQIFRNVSQAIRNGGNDFSNGLASFCGEIWTGEESSLKVAFVWIWLVDGLVLLNLWYLIMSCHKLFVLTYLRFFFFIIIIIIVIILDNNYNYNLTDVIFWLFEIWCGKVFEVLEAMWYEKIMFLYLFFLFREWKKHGKSFNFSDDN